MGIEVKEEEKLIMRKGENYYLYRVRSVWDKEKKKTRLRTKEYLGKTHWKVS